LFDGNGSLLSLPQLAHDPVLDPLRAPPVDRCDRMSGQQHREMQMIAAGEAGLAAQAWSAVFVDGLAPSRTYSAPTPFAA
jgi:hypothetical protein